MMENQVAKTNIKNEIATAIGNTTIADSILSNFDKLVTQEQLRFPDNYDLGNQIKLAYLKIVQDSNLAGCTPASIGQGLTEMALQGLEINKAQCYFIKFGSQMKMFRSYFGDVAVAFRTGLVKDIKAVVIYDGDEIETGIENDEEIVVSHKTSFANRDNGIVGAYAVATLPEGNKRYCIMTKKEIDKSWSKSRSGGGTQKDFPQEMAKRTVIRRLVKMLFNTANTQDNYVSAVVASYNRTTEEEYKPEAEAKTTVANNIIDEDEFALEKEEEIPLESEEDGSPKE